MYFFFSDFHVERTLQCYLNEKIIIKKIRGISVYAHAQIKFRSLIGNLVGKIKCKK